MLKKIILGVLGLLVLAVGGVAVVASRKPDDFRYTRSAAIAAPPDVLFQHVNDLHKFQAWNPWAKVDPSSTITYSGPEMGVGASYAWAGNSQVGSGVMTITETKPSELVRCRMDFKTPMEGTSTADFTFVPQGDKTLVTWSLYGPNNFVGKVMSVFIDCDKMCGDSFVQGLENLRALTETKPQS